MTLHATIEGLAEQFAASIVRALRGVSLDDLASLDGGRSRTRGPTRTRTHTTTRARANGKRIRRSPEELEAAAMRIVAEVQRHKDGIRAEDLKRAMGVQPGNVGAKVFTIPLTFALKSKKIAKRGARRATTYYAK